MPTFTPEARSPSKSQYEEKSRCFQELCQDKHSSLADASPPENTNGTPQAHRSARLPAFGWQLTSFHASPCQLVEAQAQLAPLLVAKEDQIRQEEGHHHQKHPDDDPNPFDQPIYRVKQVMKQSNDWNNTNQT